MKPLLILALIFPPLISAASAAKPCALLTRDEAAKALGASVEPGATAGPLGSACQWAKTGGNGHVQVQVVRPQDWSPPKLAPKYKKLAGIGKAAYTDEELGGFTAAALTDKNLVAVELSGGTASPETATALLKLVLARVE